MFFLILFEIPILQVTIPFLLLHGEEDRVTDPEISRELFDKARSEDKEFKLYPGMWHGLTNGEPDDNIELVFNDIIHWINKRSPSGGEVGGSPLRHVDVSAVTGSILSKETEMNNGNNFKLDQEESTPIS